jgi:hypothetical protein
LQEKAAEASINSSIMQVQVDSTTALLELQNIVSQYGHSFTCINAATAFVKAAKLRHLKPPARAALLDELAGIWDHVLLDAEPRQLANVLWACGKLRYTNPQLWSSTLAAYLELLEHSNQRSPCLELSSVLHGMATVAAANRGLIPGLSWFAAEAAVCQLVERTCAACSQGDVLPGDVSPQTVSNTLWACAKLRINPGDAALNCMLQAMAQPTMLEAAAPQALANSLWGASELLLRCGWKVRQDQQQIWQALLADEQLLKVANRGTPIEVSNTMLAVMRLASAAAAFAGSTATAAGPAATLVSSWELAQRCAATLLQGKVAQQLKLWSPQAVTNSMFACAQLGMYDARFLGHVSATAHKWLPKATAAGLGQVAYACRTLQYADCQLIAGVVQRSKQLLQQRGTNGLHEGSQRNQLAAQVGSAVAALDLQQLAGDVLELIRLCGLAQHNADASSIMTVGYAGSKQRSSSGFAGQLGMLWDVHCWLVQHQLLDGQGLAGLLSQQQLQQGRVEASRYHAQQQQQQQQRQQQRRGLH